MTSITVDLLLGPDQSYSTLSTWDHIHSGAYQVWGGSMPQTSVEPDVLMSLAEKVAKAALSRGIVGHISVDFVTFIHLDDVSYYLLYTAIIMVIIDVTDYMGS